MKYFMITYRKGSGGIRKSVEEYTLGPSIESVTEEYLHEEFGMKPEKDCFESDKYIHGGLFCDHISNGGDWMYFDLEITEIKRDEIKFEVEISLGEFETIFKEYQPMWYQHIPYNIHRLFSIERQVKREAA